MKTQRALITVGQAFELEHILASAVPLFMTKNHAQSWIEFEPRIREAVEALLRVDPQSLDFEWLVNKVKVALGLRFSEKARRRLLGYDYKIVEIPPDLCFETVPRRIRVSEPVPRFYEVFHYESPNNIEDEVFLHLEEAAYFLSEERPFVADTRNLNFESGQKHFKENTDDIQYLTAWGAKAVVPNVALACFLLLNEFEEGKYRGPEMTVWASEVHALLSRYVVYVKNGKVGVSSRDMLYSDDDLGFLLVVVPVPC
ncbi:MAG: hypothetical protein MUP45_01530 [Candidatus Marinimicrobia bacterium]|nr:hypothetical protein [Candidatus Neomarinimicrobiota bacterium]